MEEEGTAGAGLKMGESMEAAIRACMERHFFFLVTKIYERYMQEIT